MSIKTGKKKRMNEVDVKVGKKLEFCGRIHVKRMVIEIT